MYFSKIPTQRWGVRGAGVAGEKASLYKYRAQGDTLYGNMRRCLPGSWGQQGVSLLAPEDRLRVMNSLRKGRFQLNTGEGWCGT